MNNRSTLQNNLTILVNSCDAYEDLWVPFFTLLKKYWNPVGIRLILNTESKSFQFDGMNIECIHTSNCVQYGQRMLNVLSQISTTYVLSLLDDFFLRSPVDVEKINQILYRMDNDQDIVCFSCDCNKVYADWELDIYPGYRRQPPGNNYILSMQAAVWRTKKLQQLWRPNVSPWEWEVISNTLTTRNTKDKYYCITTPQFAFMDYGHSQYGDIWGVFRGKWVIEDVGPLFDKEGISVDFTLRGIYCPTSQPNCDINQPRRWDHYSKIYRCMGLSELIKYFLFCQLCRFKRILGKPTDADYIQVLKKKAQRDFLQQQKNTL